MRKRERERVCVYVYDITKRKNKIKTEGKRPVSPSSCMYLCVCVYVCVGVCIIHTTVLLHPKHLHLRQREANLELLSLLFQKALDSLLFLLFFVGARLEFFFRCDNEEYVRLLIRGRSREFEGRKRKRRGNE